MSDILSSSGESYENAYIEQAEYISEADFQAWSAEHPDEENIIRRLSAGGAKLLIGPRGCGKTTLLLKAYHGMLSGDETNAFPVYVNFKLSLRLEPLYLKNPNATFWFSRWLIAKIYEAVHETLISLDFDAEVRILPRLTRVRRVIRELEAGSFAAIDSEIYEIHNLKKVLKEVAEATNRPRLVLLLDDAAHAFSSRQQEDFFEFFRQIKSKEISPKAAIYPGITTTSASFHVGHDAEKIDAWIRPDTQEYRAFMRSLAEKRFAGTLRTDDPSFIEGMDFLAYCAFGIPRSFLNMVRALHLEELPPGANIDRRKLLNAAKLSREAAHNVYESLSFKLPAYRMFIQNGQGVYAKMLDTIKYFNVAKEDDNQAFEVGIKRPIPSEIGKLLSFFQYAGLMMPSGENRRGVKGTFELYMVHFGDLVTENAIVGRRTKSVPTFLVAFKSQTHQAWPRIAPDRLVSSDNLRHEFSLSLPVCQNCGAPRLNEDARFCHNCGAQLKSASVYEQLVNQDISVLPITAARSNSIKTSSAIRTVKDILIDTSREALRNVPYIGPVWAERIVHYAEEHVA